LVIDFSLKLVGEIIEFKPLTTVNADQLLSLIIPILFLFILLFLFFISNKINKYSQKFEGEHMLVNYNKISNINFSAGSFTILFFFSFLILFLPIYKFHTILNYYLPPSLLLLILDIGLFVLILYFLYFNSKDYKYRIKLYLNKKYGKKYPYVYISTVGSSSASGQVKDIFNGKYLILDNNGVEEIILWTSIDIIKIQDSKTPDTSYQKSILDYYR